MSLKKNYVVTKRNILNDIRANNMTLQELRFFSIYLSKINSQDTSTRVVKFPIADFQKIMDFGRININQFAVLADSLLTKTVKIPTERGGLEVFQLFKECKIDMDMRNNWYVEIDAHDKALPLMFEFKNQYFTYKLWNALSLKSSNQLRMYEILKQYEKIGTRIISIEELKELLGIESSEYKRFGDFKIRVLEACRLALHENTDIDFTYESTGKKGSGGKVYDLKFTISRNEKYKNPLQLEDFIKQSLSENEKSVRLLTYEKSTFHSDILNFLLEACDNEFSLNEIQLLYNLVIKILPPKKVRQSTEAYDYLKRKYDELNFRSQRSKINNRFAYLKKMIESDMDI